jgi:hypothetical protein
MPIYNVNRAHNGVWNLMAGPHAHMPTAHLELSGNSIEVKMDYHANVAFDGPISGVHTMSLTSCSAICILWQNAAGVFVRGALNHMAGCAHLTLVDWTKMMAGMGADGTYWAILANSKPTYMTEAFVAGIPDVVRPDNRWVYEANHPGGGINFGFDRDGLAGEPIQRPPASMGIPPVVIDKSLPKKARGGP